MKKSYTVIFFFVLCFKGMKIFFVFSVLIAFMGLNDTFAQPSSEYVKIDFPSSFNPLGSGARALGMGGAFIGIADDATAASWNPGGLIQIERPEVSFAGSWFHKIEDNKFSLHPESDGSDSISMYDINYFSILYPFTLFNRHMVISLNYQNLYEFSRNWSYPIEYEMNGTNSNKYNMDYYKKGSLSALGLAYCTKFITPQLSLGVTLNFWDNDFNNKWEEKLYGAGIETLLIPEIGSVQYYIENIRTNRYSFSGFNYNIGLLWTIKKLENKLKIGFVFKSPFMADLEHELTQKDVVNGNIATQSNGRWDEELKMPMSFGIGFSYRFSDMFRLGVDIYRTEWQDFILTNSKGVEISPITNNSLGESDINATHQVRIGIEYLYTSGSKYIIPLRSGVFYDPAPASGGYDEYYGFALGIGIKGEKKNIFDYAFDVAYQYRFGNNLDTAISPRNAHFHDVEEHMLCFSFIMRLNEK